MIAVLGISLTACNNATPQGQLANILPDHNHEVFVYDAFNTKDDSTGVYTVNLDAFKSGAEVEFGTRKLENVDAGIRVLGTLVFGNTKYEMGCYYKFVSGTSFMTPAYTFRIVTENGNKTLDIQGAYAGGNFTYERFTGEGPHSETLKTSGTVFDNNQFQQVLRSVTTFSSGLTLSFTTPIVTNDDAGIASLTASGSSTTKLKNIPYTDAMEQYAEEGVPCYVINISRSTEVAGMSHTLYYATDNIKSNGWAMKNILVKIVEPFTENNERFEMQYTLRSASLS
ncbi:MAG: hypothetical protein K2M36_02920 [Clostridia bacterium]|nr:hypothetical protein [Clostridia bacterium]